jgi:hypothetical protein
MKKALQTGQLRARVSLPDGPAGFGGCDTRRDRLCDDFPQIFVADPSNE